MIERTVFHLDDPRPLAWSRKKKPMYIYYPPFNEDVVGAERNRKILVMIDNGSYKAPDPRWRSKVGKHIAKMDRKRKKQ